jgi:hypothetical protein
MSGDLYQPDEIVEAYQHGLVGSYCDPADTARLLQSLPMPLFGNTLHGTGAGKLSLPFKAVVAFEVATGRKPYDEAQTTGDCVSMAVRGAIDVARANDPDLQTKEDWVDRTATENLYGARGHGGQGASCSRLVGWAHQTGGCMLRKAYPELGLDFSTYDASKGIRWGSRGVPENVTAEAAKHRIGTISLVNSWEQARDAIANGFGLVCCSDVGFRTTRSSDPATLGMSFPSGSWNHAMHWNGVDDTRPGDCRFCVQNSWGWSWLSGSKAHDQPEGSFWIDQKAAQRMISQGGTYAVSNVDGFPKRQLKDWGAREVLG